MTEEQKISAERKELNALINKGVTFEVEVPKFVRRKGIFGRLRKPIKTTEKRKLVIQEPTLSTLDRISAEQIELRIDENVMSTENGIAEAKKLVNQHGRRMARIVALAVMGQDYAQAMQSGSHISYKLKDKELDELTDLIFANVKPSMLMQLTVLVNTMSNLGDFMNSIRLMSAARTTMPIRIEGSTED